MAKKNNIKTHEEFLLDLEERNPDAYHSLDIIGRYNGSGKKILAVSKYGQISITPYNILSGKSPCIRAAVSMSEYFRNQAIEVHGDKYLYEKVVYFRENSEVIITCRKHGDFNQLPVVHIGGSGCPKCAHERRGMSSRRSHNSFIEKFKEVNKELFDKLEIIGEYENAHIKILAKNKYGLVNITPNWILSGRGVGIKAALNKTLYFISMAKEKHGDKYDYSKVAYINGRVKIEIICPIHGSFMQTPNNHLHPKAYGCSMCHGVFNKKYSKNNIPTYETFAKDFKSINIKCRRNIFDNNILEVPCYFCGKMFIPSYISALNKKNTIRGNMSGENNMYCSEKCKDDCTVYNFRSDSIDPNSKLYVGKSDQQKARACKTDHLKILQVDELGYNYCEKCGKKVDIVELTTL